MSIAPDLIASHGLTPDEYDRIVHILGLDPNYTELGIFSVMWSEHCSYKSSRVHLRGFPTTGPRVVQGPGENAGVIDIGDGWVRGIAGYGNCIGIPTVGGETSFHPSYNGNILVNVFALGVAKREKIFKGTASGVGNPVIYVGSKTGRDGI